ncbi:hypothetical protein BS50DRAFT_275057 [Corynespora cassiicola Philippines]|uniref:Uncharacterized protein n=1 Tax=Corynespora cassiicola Philippines TaxID=1448308 RepID=A0A2T2P0V5_CORCC|nr:hypothetical protein BS50DRAFT_275057 [Corynespora cassiicola Philippines]
MENCPAGRWSILLGCILGYRGGGRCCLLCVTRSLRERPWFAVICPTYTTVIFLLIAYSVRILACMNLSSEGLIADLIDLSGSSNSNRRVGRSNTTVICPTSKTILTWHVKSRDSILTWASQPLERCNTTNFPVT